MPCILPLFFHARSVGSHIARLRGLALVSGIGQLHGRSGRAVFLWIDGGEKHNRLFATIESKHEVVVFCMPTAARRAFLGRVHRFRLDAGSRPAKAVYERKAQCSNTEPFILMEG